MPRGDHTKPGRPSGVEMRAKQDPKKRMGVYKSISEVPDRYKLSNFANQFRGEDTWTRYLLLRYDGSLSQAQGQLSNSRARKVERCGRYFKEFMHRKRGTHHALATPDDVEAFLLSVKDGYKNPTKQPRSITTVYSTYFAPVNQFYDWLQAWVDFSHRYHPVLMACADGGVARDCWTYRIDKADRQFAEVHGEPNE